LLNSRKLRHTPSLPLLDPSSSLCWACRSISRSKRKHRELYPEQDRREGSVSLLLPLGWRAFSFSRNACCKTVL